MKPVTRISLGLAGMTAGILLFADVLGLAPKPRADTALRARAETVQTLGVKVARAVQKNEIGEARIEPLRRAYWASTNQGKPGPAATYHTPPDTPDRLSLPG